MNLLSEEIEAYAALFTEDESPVLAELNRETQAHIIQPRMLSGHLQGRLLSLFSKLVKPKLILEIGSFTGYSALCLAEGLQPDGLLHTIDIDEERETIITKYIKKAQAENKICLHIGDANSIIPKIKGTFDLVFIDADKVNYINYFNLVANRINAGGLIIADNVLWRGNVLKPINQQDEETQILTRYVRLVKNDKRFQSVLLPIRDGLMIAFKR